MSSKNIILASESPRRKYLLEQAGIEFDVVPSNIDESIFKKCSPREYVTKLSSAKACDVAERYQKSWVIGADTIVVINGEILEKPESKEHAEVMLGKLSNNTHMVYSGFSLCCKSQGRIITGSVKTDVKFKKLSNREIQWYINTNEPFDKAGAYAIQGLGASFIKSINGSYTNVVGLPVCELIEILIEENVISR